MSKLETILQYQETEKKKQDLEAAVRSTPARMQFNRLHKLLKTQQATIQKLCEEMEIKTAHAQKLAEKAKALESRYELESGELDNISKDEESTAEEMTELKNDVKKLSAEIAQTTREAKILFTEISKAKENYIEANRIARDAKKEYDELRATCEKERDESQVEINKIDDELKKIAKGLDADFVSKFEKVRQHHAVPVVPVVDGKCSGCNMSLPMVMIKKLNTPDTFVECENCGRILYGE